MGTHWNSGFSTNREELENKRRGEVENLTRVYGEGWKNLTHKQGNSLKGSKGNYKELVEISYKGTFLGYEFLWCGNGGTPITQPLPGIRFHTEPVVCKVGVSYKELTYTRVTSFNVGEMGGSGSYGNSPPVSSSVSSKEKELLQKKEGKGKGKGKKETPITPEPTQETHKEVSSPETSVLPVEENTHEVTQG